MHRRTTTTELIRDVLKETYLGLDITHIALVEDIAGGAGSRVDVTLREARDDTRERSISGKGVGIVDALYHGLVQHYAPEYPSLRTITFTGFDVTGRMGTSHQQGLDAEAAVTLTVQNSDKRTFEFGDSDRSLVAAALSVVTDAAEFFINSERAFVTVYRALCDARERGRADLVQTYTAQLAELVNTTSYSEVIERIKSEAL